MSAFATATTVPQLKTELVRWKSVLVLTDLSASSKKALEYAAQIARQFGSTVHMLHAVAPIAVADYGANGPGLVVPEIEVAAEQEMRILAEGEALKGIEHTWDVQVGTVPMLVEEMTSKYRIDLIVCATHAPGALERLTFGSVAEWVARGSGSPCMLLGKEAVKRERPFEMKRVLFATALKADSLRSVQFAEGFAGAIGAELMVMHVVEKSGGSVEDVRERMSGLLWKDLVSAGVAVEHGDVVKGILRRAEQMKPDLIVMGLRQGPLAHHAPWAKVSEVLAQAKCPVLAVPEHFR